MVCVEYIYALCHHIHCGFEVCLEILYDSRYCGHMLICDGLYCLYKG
jgi:hypothetical protein